MICRDPVTEVLKCERVKRSDSDALGNRPLYNRKCLHQPETRVYPVTLELPTAPKPVEISIFPTSADFGAAL